MNKENNSPWTLGRLIEAFFLIFILLICWFSVFIFQGSLDYHRFLLLVPLTFSIIFVVSFLSLMIICGLLEIPHRKKWSFFLSLLFIGLSFFYQQKKIDPYFQAYSFKNERFSHLSPQKIKSSFQKRLIVSSIEGLKLLPLPEIDQQTVQYLGKVVQETLLIFELKELISSQGTKYICQQYPAANDLKSHCLIDFHNEFMQIPTLSAEGNILITAVAALAIFKSKENDFKAVERPSRKLVLKYFVDILEISLNSCQKAKEAIFLSENKLNDLIEEQLEYNHLLVASSKLKNLTLQAQKEAHSLADSDQLKRIKFIKEEIKNLKMEEIVVKVRGRTFLFNEELKKAKNESLFMALGQNFDEKLSSKLVRLLSAPQDSKILSP